jgi:glucose-1-phosphatase
MAIKAVLFDIGGVLELVDDARWPHQWLDDWSARLGLARAEVDDRLDSAGLGSIGAAAGSEQAYRDVYRRALGLSDQQLDAMFGDMWDRYCGRLDTDLMGYVETLAPTYRLGVISNSADGARREEERRHGFSRLFDPIIYSHEEGVEKPAPAIWALACGRVWAEPADTVLVDDAEVNVEAARAFGIQAILHTDTPTTLVSIARLLR